ncbi:hypothetical protein WJX75_008647 [Coccomyxa subellipsoidea]|uniref:Uncharacterized protein n=1 Tax=Coccomyxa subellipsoidea TaxID=248742 RepID=A0ABR2Z5G8_9CHLO
MSYLASQHDADKTKGGFTAQARGFGMLGKEVAKKAGKTFIQSSQLAASYLLDKAKKEGLFIIKGAGPESPQSRGELFED